MSNALLWFRQDLRLSDNPALTHACSHHDSILPIYILDESETFLGDAQHWWLHHSLISLDNNLKKFGLNLYLRRGNAFDILKQLVHEHQIEAIYWNRCYEPHTIERDTTIKQFFQTLGIQVISSNGSLLNEPWQITTTTGHFFKVFTPYWRACLKQLHIPSPLHLPNTPQSLPITGDSIEDWKLLPTQPNWASAFENYWQPGEEGAQTNLTDFVDFHLQAYDTTRDIPIKNATSRLSPHLHFGEISPWQILRAIETVKLDKSYNLKSIERFLAEIGWREFSYHLLYHLPSLPEKNFKSDFDAFPWKNDEQFLKQWQKGKTGYPIVDAGMRELWHTGYMHNRVRMIVASFLTKDLLIDWRLGANWFLNTLLDADLANNSASWQWVAGCGADAAPYFRIFNPVLQGEKFDPGGDYIKQWIPELQPVPTQWIHQPWTAPSNKLGIYLGRDYPYPLVEHAKARKEALHYYKSLEKKTDNAAE